MNVGFICDVGSDLPDAGGGTCCYGAAAMGPERCTCWEPEYDLEQMPAQAGPMAVRREQCVDCAFRPGSPEQTGDERFAHSGDGEVESLVGSSTPFVCHQGMRRILRLRHPSGAVVESNPGDYAPPGSPSDTPCKADGSPADVCPGWLAAHRKLMRGIDQDE